MYLIHLFKITLGKCLRILIDLNFNNSLNTLGTLTPFKKNGDESAPETSAEVKSILQQEIMQWKPVDLVSKIQGQY